MRGSAGAGGRRQPATSPMPRVPRQSWQQHDPAGDGGAERGGAEADQRREAERDDGVDDHRMDGEAERASGCPRGHSRAARPPSAARRPAGRRRRSRRRARSGSVSAAPKAPRWNSTETIGTGITISATAAGSGQREGELGGAVDGVAAALGVAGLAAGARGRAAARRRSRCRRRRAAAGRAGRHRRARRRRRRRTSRPGGRRAG